MSRNYPSSVWRRAMKIQEVIFKFMAGEISGVEAEEILGYTPRHFYRLRMAYQEQGVDGLVDRRRGRPSPKKAPYEDVQQILRLYWDNYRDYNVAHFHDKLTEKHDLTYSYSFVLKLLQSAGYVKKKKGRGGHRKRRDRRPLFGQMLHLDGSDHEWLALRPGERQMLLLIIDDATSDNLAGELVDEETTVDCMRLMRRVVERYGIAAQFYSDRGSVYWTTPKAGGKVDRENLTQFGRALEQLGIEMIPAYSPQARGRSERWFSTWQGRLVNELKTAGIDNTTDANKYINGVFIPDMRKKFTVKPAEQGSAFVSARGADLDRIFAIKHERMVAADNTVRVNGLVLQIEQSLYRTSFAKCKVEVYEHLEGTYSVDWKKRLIGRFNPEGKNMASKEKEQAGKSKPADGGPRSPYGLPQPPIGITP